MGATNAKSDQICKTYRNRDVKAPRGFIGAPEEQRTHKQAPWEVQRQRLSEVAGASASNLVSKPGSRRARLGNLRARWTPWDAHKCVLCAAGAAAEPARPQRERLFAHEANGGRLAEVSASALTRRPDCAFVHTRSALGDRSDHAPLARRSDAARTQLGTRALASERWQTYAKHRGSRRCGVAVGTGSAQVGGAMAGCLRGATR